VVLEADVRAESGGVGGAIAAVIGGGGGVSIAWRATEAPPPLDATTVGASGLRASANAAAAGSSGGCDGGGAGSRGVDHRDEGLDDGRDGPRES